MILPDAEVAEGERTVKAILAIVLLLLPGAAMAQVAPPPPSGRPPVGVTRLAPHTVDEIAILPRATCLAPSQDPNVPPPKIVSTFPAQGDIVRPGVLVVRITFDRPMSCDGFVFSDPILDQACPKDRQDLLLSLDRKTVRTICHPPPVGAFSLWLNENPASGPRPNLKNQFISLTGWPAQPFRLTFSTSNGKRVRTLREALLEDPNPGIANLQH
jgi:hypothetical protein